MTVLFDKDHLIGTADYRKNFWNYMCGRKYVVDSIKSGTNISTGGFALPSSSDEKLRKRTHRDSQFRNIATVVNAHNCGYRIFAKNCEDLAEWVPENGAIPIYDGSNDFTQHSIETHKLATFVRFDNAFLHDVSFDFEDHLIKRLARSFAEAEDYGFTVGTGEHMPTGILDENTGAQIGVSTDAISFDKIIQLFFSLDKKYRKNAVWMMNDDTALTLRLLKDSEGNPLWNHANDTILGKPVVISNYMPSANDGEMPIVFGDFSYYWIIDRCPVDIQPLKEKFAEYDQTGFLAMEFLDGKLIRREALQALKINNSEQNT